MLSKTFTKIIFLLTILTLAVELVSAESYFYMGSDALATIDESGNLDYVYRNRLGTDFETDVLPFGQIIETGERFGFTGKEQDGSGLHYFAARYYDSNLGRFTSKDPVITEPSYQYVANKPLNNIDPTGKNLVTALIKQVYKKIFQKSGTKIAREATQEVVERSARRAPIARAPLQIDLEEMTKLPSQRRAASAARIDPEEMPLARELMDDLHPENLARVNNDGDMLFPLNSHWGDVAQKPLSTYPQGLGNIVDGKLMIKGEPANGAFIFVVDEKGSLKLFQDEWLHTPPHLQKSYDGVNKGMTGIGHSSLTDEYAQAAGWARFEDGKLVKGLTDTDSGHFHIVDDKSKFFDIFSTERFHEVAEKAGLKTLDSP